MDEISEKTYNLLENRGLFERLREVPWGEAAASIERLELDYPVRQVQSQSEAARLVQGDHWQSVRRVTQNELTVHLNSHHQRKYQEWNRPALVMERLLSCKISSVFERSARREGIRWRDIDPEFGGIFEPLAERLQIPVEHARTAMAYEFQLMACWTYFQEHNLPHRFPMDLLKVYELGRIPVGWSGFDEAWPNGSLLIY